MAPIHLERLIEICCSTAIESCPHVMRETGTCKPLDELEAWGLIESDPRVSLKDYENHGWVATDKGKFHLDTLLGISFPTQKWVASKQSEKE